MSRPMRTTTAVLRVVFDNSLLLLLGAVTALAWANLDLVSYERFAHAFHFTVNYRDCFASGILSP